MEGGVSAGTRFQLLSQSHGVLGQGRQDVACSSAVWGSVSNIQGRHIHAT